eukprot:COSAG01_NODE_433_length_17113_cov_23.009757_10_plen_429_part_00
MLAQVLHAHDAPRTAPGAQAISATRNDGLTPLLAACQCGQFECVRWLWAQLNDSGRQATTRGGNHCLGLAAGAGAPKLVRWLLAPTQLRCLGLLMSGERARQTLVFALIRQACTVPWQPASASARRRPPPDPVAVIRLLLAWEAGSSRPSGSLDGLRGEPAALGGIDLRLQRLGVGGLTGPTALAAAVCSGQLAVVSWLLKLPGAIAASERRSGTQQPHSGDDAHHHEDDDEEEEEEEEEEQGFDDTGGGGRCAGGSTLLEMAAGQGHLGALGALLDAEWAAAGRAWFRMAPFYRQREGAVDVPARRARQRCTAALRVATRLERGQICAYLRRAVGLDVHALATVGARQRLSWARLLVSTSMAATAAVTAVVEDAGDAGTCAAALLLSHDLLLSVGMGVQWASASATLRDITHADLEIGRGHRNNRCW